MVDTANKYKVMEDDKENIMSSEVPSNTNGYSILQTELKLAIDTLRNTAGNAASFLWNRREYAGNAVKIVLIPMVFAPILFAAAGTDAIAEYFFKKELNTKLRVIDLLKHTIDAFDAATKPIDTLKTQENHTTNTDVTSTNITAATPLLNKADDVADDQTPPSSNNFIVANQTYASAAKQNNI